MRLTAKDFKHMRFNPADPVPPTELLGLVPQEIAAFQGNLIRYVIAMYDDASPLAKTETNLKRRKSMAASIAGFDLEQDDGLLQKVYTCELPGLTELIIGYMFRYTHQRLWHKIVVNEQLFQEYTGRLLRPVTAGGETDKEKDELQAYQIKAKLREELDAISNSLDKYYKELFQGDEDLLEKPIPVFTPESMAMAG